MNMLIHFHINSTSVIRPSQTNHLNFSSIEINKPLPAQSTVFRSQFNLLPQIGCLITLKIESSIISIDSNTAENIIKKVIHLQQDKCRTNSVALRNSSINQMLLWRLTIQNHSKPSIPQDLSSRRKPAYQTLSRALHTQTY